MDRYAQVTVRVNRTPCPRALSAVKLRVLLNASDLVVFDGRTEIARHERTPRPRAWTRVDLDHYLEALLRKPSYPVRESAGAGQGIRAVHARSRRLVGRACKAHGDADGTRALIEVLMMHRHLPDTTTSSPGLATALRAGALTADAVAGSAQVQRHSRWRSRRHDSGPPVPDERRQGT